MTKVLAIDPAIASIGWAVVEDETALAYSVITTSSKRQTPDRLIEIQVAIFKICSQYSPDLLVYEKPFLPKFNTNADRVHMAVGAILVGARNAGVEAFFNVQQSAVKKVVTGSGSGNQNRKKSTVGEKKEQVKQCVIQLFGLSADVAANISSEGKDDLFDA